MSHTQPGKKPKYTIKKMGPKLRKAFQNPTTRDSRGPSVRPLGPRRGCGGEVSAGAATINTCPAGARARAAHAGSLYNCAPVSAGPPPGACAPREDALGMAPCPRVQLGMQVLCRGGIFRNVEFVSVFSYMKHC